MKGCSWSTGLSEVAGIAISVRIPAVLLDELIFVVRKESGLIFDECLPGWHLYGTDIVQTALDQGFGAFIIDAPVIHNSLPVFRLDRDYADGYHYLRHKRADRLSIMTTCIEFTRRGWPLRKRQLIQLFESRNREFYERLPDTAEKARELGYE